MNTPHGSHLSDNSPMIPQNSLDHSGKLSVNPLAELLVELEQARLDGSVRLESGDVKAIVYLRAGSITFAVSNAREHRLLNIILEQNLVDQTQLAGIPKCSNDVELGAALVNSKLISADDLKNIVTGQLERILVSVLSWTEGNWHFSPLVRSREDLGFEVGVHKLLVNYARCQPMSAVMGRFKSVQEQFERANGKSENPALQAHESFVLERFGSEPRAIEDLTLECGLPENGFLHAIYVLWLGGMLHRRDWNAAFSKNRIAAIQNARIALIKKAQQAAAVAKDVKPEEPESDTQAPPPETDKPKQPEIDLDQYLALVESGATHYDVLSVDPKAKTDEIKSSYLNLAKLFHPDRFHRESPETLKRIQGAFSNVQSAYETLKSSDSRDNYDFKVRKELAMKKKLKEQGVAVGEGKIDAKTEQGLESFEVGLSLLMDGDFERAIPFLGRAAHYNPDNALYRAYLGKALAHEDKQRHRAEGELQAAVRLDPGNPKIRLMLIDFFMEQNLLKRAEGELKRFLEIAPENVEAKKLLAQLQN